MTPLTTQELAMSLEPRVEVWFENINLEVTSIQMTFNAIYMRSEQKRRYTMRRAKRSRPSKIRSQKRRIREASKKKIIRT